MNSQRAKTYDRMKVYPTQMNTQSHGGFRVRCNAPGFIPIENATISITYSGEPNRILEELHTDVSGLTPTISLEAPPIEYSLEPSLNQPYSLYDLRINAPGYGEVAVDNVEIFPDVNSQQNTVLLPMITGQSRLYVIPPHTLFGYYPPKIAEAEIKPTGETGEIVLSRVVVPEYIIVHDGPPTDSSAQNHWVLFRDYIKNVACSEIYSTWPEATIYANILAILSFTLNRVYTEWYRNQGYSFTITSSTAYDHKWMQGRNIFDNISYYVDSIFNNYLSRPNIRQPIFTQYCDGNRVSCPNWMSQWGSKTLGDQGKSAIEILRHYYGSNIYINTAPEVSGVPQSWPGSDLSSGSTGESVRIIQEQLNTISTVYSVIPKLLVDGIYGPNTIAAVNAFQGIFNLPQTGVVNFATWYKISQIYVGVTRIAEL